MYYVYAYFDPDTCKPIYIGKGHGDRCVQHFSRENLKRYDMFHQHLRKLIYAGKIPIVRIIHNHLAEEVAYEVEIAYIKKYGMQINATGILYNMIIDSRERRRHRCKR